MAFGQGFHTGLPWFKNGLPVFGTGNGCDDVLFADCAEWIDWLYDYWITNGDITFDYDLMDGPDNCSACTDPTQLCTSFSGPLIIPSSAILSYVAGTSIAGLVSNNFNAGGHCGLIAGSTAGYVFNFIDCDFLITSMGTNGAVCGNWPLAYSVTYTMPILKSEIQTTAVPGSIVIGPTDNTCQPNGDGLLLL